MVGIIVLLLIILLWSFLKTHQEWYVVEVRICSDERLCSCALDNADFGRRYLAAHNLVIDRRRKGSARILHKDGGYIVIEQKVFANREVARLYFDKLMGQIHGSGKQGPLFRKAFIRRVAARSRRSALVLPPGRYHERMGVEMLMEYPDSCFTAQGRA